MTGAVIADESTRIDSAAAKVAEDTPLRLKGQKVFCLLCVCLCVSASTNERGETEMRERERAQGRRVCVCVYLCMRA